MESSFGPEGMRYRPVGFEEELIKKYIRHQEILDAKGYDDELDKGEKDKDENKDDGKF